MSEDTRPTIEGGYYSNILMVSEKLAPLTTVSDKRAKWYTERGLAEYLPEEERLDKFPSYDSVVKLKFKPKLEDNKDPFYQQIIETRCVVCGERKGLSLHHVVPSVVRKHLPNEHKNHSHGWCVLLCEKHHLQADQLAQELHERELKELNLRILAKQKEMKQEWAEDFIKRNGGIEPIKDLYRQKFKSLEPQFLPLGFLEDHNVNLEQLT